MRCALAVVCGLSLFDMLCVLSVVCCVLLVACCMLCVVCCLLFVVGCCGLLCVV